MDSVTNIKNAPLKRKSNDEFDQNDLPRKQKAESEDESKSGGYGKDSKGNLVLKQNQTLSSGSNASVKKSLLNHQPVGVIIGDRNKEIGRSLPHRYNVMDFFVVTHVWPERIGAFIGYMMRLQKIDLTSKSWWAAKGSPEPPANRDFHTRPDAMICHACSHESCRIFKGVWACLNEDCPRFWEFINGPPTTELEYDPVFLSHRFFWDVANLPESPTLVPLPPVITDDNRLGYRVGDQARRGFICPNCRKCLPRVFWKGWNCTVQHYVPPKPRSNELGCPFTVNVEGPAIPFENVIAPPDSLPGPLGRRKISGKGTTMPRGGLESFYNQPRFAPNTSGPDIDRVSMAPYVRLRYSIAGGNIGTVDHIVSNLAINAKDRGPNFLFQRFQELDLGLRRERLTHAPVKGLMTGHFLVNIGLPYKFVVSTQSKSFSDTHQDVLVAHSRLVWATEKIVAESNMEYQKPNELLLVCYVTNMDMGYHDDGEDDLGPTVATLSLGGSSTMFLRMKKKYFVGLRQSKNGAPTLTKDDPVLDGCQNYDQRKALKDRYDQGFLTEPEYDEERWKILKSAEDAAPILKMELHHGHMVVMNGEGLQKYYEHKVVPDGGLRFAVTARHIQEDTVKAEDTWMGQYKLPSGQAYNGE
ncbi:hypothetical protein N7481_005295 [Penicillium waksmanii]|uniref:uncharacterized protein n=1 Tax=Penicillium waksmanii TaxID=69791 RepID=UPI002547BC57|nr:uncharacterized protein N7481_005295 [Penicillium waksmanii]KAJ5983196.1 hypothetical protein N7481_005295 [Penicillium waksmanii]